MNTIEELYNKKQDLENQLISLNIEIKLELEKLPIVDALVILFEEEKLPTCQIFDSWGKDLHDGSYTIKDIHISPVRYYDYTDVIGLNEKDFKELKRRLESTN